MTRYIALIPAAGSGSRMASTVPKQYLPLLGVPLLAHALKALACVPAIDRVVLVLSPEDEWFEPAIYDAEIRAKLTVLRCGGADRASSVRNGLLHMQGELAGDDWVLVHDAARPCVSLSDIERLLFELNSDAVGGLLAQPLADTIKRSDANGRVSVTVSRDGLWRAQTPQMFRFATLLEAVTREDSHGVTDEASAIEALGFAPKLVRGSERNIKVTYPEDLALAALFLSGEGTS